MIKFKPVHLTWPNIWDKVEKFRRLYLRSKVIPIDVEALIEFDLGLDIVPTFGLKQEVGVEAFLSKNLKEIRVDNESFNSSSSANRLRFTLAEEIGHYVLHKPIYLEGVKYNSEEEFVQDILNMDEDDLNWIERQAREFAGRLLVPITDLEHKINERKTQIERFHEKYTGGENVTDLAIEGVSKIICTSFGVSWQVIKNRVRSEKLYDKFERN